MTTAIVSILTYITVALTKGRESISLTAEQKTARKLGLRLIAALAALSYIIVAALFSGEMSDQETITVAVAVLVDAAVAFLGAQGIYLVAEK